MSKLNGSWKITLHTFMGDMRSTGYFTVEGDKLVGSSKDAANGAEAPLDNGVVNGNKYEYDITIKTAVGVMTNHLVGELGEDDVIRGTSTNGMGTFEFEAVRGEF
ncbi:MAG: hypothetical protein IJA33_05275 [Oscillospiraceae bacterium]|nr:hypothetical protein [Oscillospiraceae bacterium]